MIIFKNKYQDGKFLIKFIKSKFRKLMEILKQYNNAYQFCIHKELKLSKMHKYLNEL